MRAPSSFVRLHCEGTNQHTDWGWPHGLCNTNGALRRAKPTTLQSRPPPPAPAHIRSGKTKVRWESRAWTRPCAPRRVSPRRSGQFRSAHEQPWAHTRTISRSQPQNWGHKANGQAGSPCVRRWGLVPAACGIRRCRRLKMLECQDNRSRALHNPACAGLEAGQRVRLEAKEGQKQPIGVQLRGVVWRSGKRVRCGGSEQRRIGCRTFLTGASEGQGPVESRGRRVRYIIGIRHRWTPWGCVSATVSITSVESLAACPATKPDLPLAKPNSPEAPPDGQWCPTILHDPEDPA